MSELKSGPPYRPPCGGWGTPQKLWVGDPYQHYRSTEAVVENWDNVTRVPNYADPESEGYTPTIPPYARPVGGATCGESCCVAEAIDCFYPKCSSVTGETVDPLACATPDASHVTIDRNCYVKNGTVNLASCHKLGFKNVQARKLWHGRFGFMHADGCLTKLGAECNNCEFEADHTAANDTTKYLTLEIAAVCSGSFSTVISESASTCGYENVSTISTSSGSLSKKYSIGRYDGVLRLQAGCDEQAESSTTSSVNSYEVEGCPPIDDVVTECSTTGAKYDLVGGDTCAPNPHDVTGYGLGGLRAFANSQIACGKIQFNGVGPWLTPEELEAGLIASWEGLGAGHTIDASVTLDNTELRIEITQHEDASADEGTSPFSHIEIHDSDYILLTIQLSDPYTAADVKTDLNTLLATWNMADDILYPFRTDEFVSVAPLVSYNETGPTTFIGLTPCTMFDNTPIPDPAPDGWADVDPETGLTGAQQWILDHHQPWLIQGYSNGAANPQPFDGAMRGTPGKPGDGHFDWAHQNFFHCTSGEVTFCDFVSSGAKSHANIAGDLTDSFMPATATQWTNQIDAGSYPPGAFFKNFPGGVCVAQKWAEVLIHRPSQNFFRPCGADRFLPDMANTRCVSESQSEPIILTLDILEGAPTLSESSLARWENGIYRIELVESGEDFQVTLGEKLYDVPDDGIDFTGLFGPLRFPDAWPICGRVKFVSNIPADAGTYTVTKIGEGQFQISEMIILLMDAEQTKWLMTGDEIDLSGEYANSTGAPDYKWDDAGRKGDYLIFRYGHDFRDIAENDRLRGYAETLDCNDCEDAPEVPADLRTLQDTHGMPRSVKTMSIASDCLPFLPCCPAVVCFSPNYTDEGTIDKFPNGSTYTFGESFEADDRYGSLEQIELMQHMRDLLWQAPHRPCSEESFAWQEDILGNCPADADGVKYYAHAPMVEARQSLPSIDGDPAPALPDSVNINFLSLADIDQETPPAGQIRPSSAQMGYSLTTCLTGELMSPWGLWLRQHACVDGDGRFKDEYLANGA